jgi:predicted nucleic acid-binding protein
VSVLARVEVPAALWRKNRVGALEAGDVQVLIGAFEADLFGDFDRRPCLVAVAITPAILDSAARLTGVHGLRAFDAIQLATACAAHAADPGCDTFACFDAALGRAAAAEGFALLPAAGS